MLRFTDHLRDAAAWVGGRVRPARAAGKLARFALAAFILGHVILLAVVLLSSLFLLKANPRHTALMAWRRATAGVHSPAISFTPLAQIPRPARDMVVRLEDWHFWTHAGIHLGSIRDAYLINRNIGYALYGGSTITQQLARNLFLTPRKTYFRKYLEAITALCMDLVLPKARILELYLNTIEWGRGTFGISAASARYYGVPPAALVLDQQRRLIAVLPNPLRYDVSTLLGNRQLAIRYRYLVARFPDAGGAVTAEPLAGTEAAADFPPAPAGEPMEEGEGAVEPAPKAEPPAAGLRVDPSAPPAADSAGQPATAPASAPAP
jgi:monofunctional biosynthetic peptidoglycan transglycosylase